MANPGKPEAYEQIYENLRKHPILTWACKLAGIHPSSVYELMKNNPDIKRKIDEARSEGQGKLLPHVTAERVLAWSDNETFGLRQEVTHEGGVTVNITNPAGLGMSPDTEDENDGERNSEG